jgi:hypothetical protein
MLYEAYVAADAAKDRIKRAERKAAENWRFRHIKSPESKIATAIITSVLGLFLR